MEGEEWRYNTGISESLRSNQTFTPQYILNYQRFTPKWMGGKRFEDTEWINSHRYFTLEKVNLSYWEILWRISELN